LFEAEIARQCGGVQRWPQVLRELQCLAGGHEDSGDDAGASWRQWIGGAGGAMDFRLQAMGLGRFWTPLVGKNGTFDFGEDDFCR